MRAAEANPARRDRRVTKGMAARSQCGQLANVVERRGERDRIAGGNGYGCRACRTTAVLHADSCATLASL
ncbi:hypothetical protein FQJ88_00345 [Xanthomonas vasicola]|uniref:Uncharacterized protein n=1 Tax=Xanthomonas vasicola TaxID=56459 RepID=A0ABD7SFQ0_XANVA|nr:hypothetical protein NX81_016000 [Xanthomonas vasicola]TWQ28821.1 hypothetical protein FQJ97_15420 [Xanthomonas vasicola]TWQ40671.1 hypothetical protein FQJ96_05810 [Xanthomonas vasicola]TWQ54903.1 hypothetical protein FQJ94_11330 [Xanthomonas vasicola]TWQ57514.1 hypothetical protein FQK01_00830 [Xanthomonas vasicola]